MPRIALLIVMILLYKPATAQEIKQTPREVELGEVEVTSEMARFKRDSALNHQLYRKELGYARSKAKRKLLVRTGEVGASYDGLISEAALGLSGKKKKYRKFAASLEANEQEAFVRARYNAGLVKYITGLDDSSCHDLIARHPMSYDFARSASELELRSWIMQQYKKDRKP